MPNYNKVILMGNLTREIEVKYTPNGTAVADIGLAINRTSKDRDGKKTQETTFVDITLWGRTAEVAQKYSGKGQPLFIEGRIQMESWEDKDTGRKRQKLKVIGESIQLMGEKGNANTPSNQQENHAKSYVEDNYVIPF